MNELASLLTVVAVVISGINTYLITLWRSDLSKSENRLTDKFDKRYVSQKEADMLVRERDSYRLEANKRLESIEQSINEIKQLLMDRHK